LRDRVKEGAGDATTATAGRAQPPALAISEIDERLIGSGRNDSRIMELVATHDAACWSE
jgi:hypothetical protein